MSEPPKPKPPTPEQMQASVARQLEGLTANTVLCIQALEAKLTTTEQAEISAAVERASLALKAGVLDPLQISLREMERAAGIIGVAMLRAEARKPDPK